MTSQSGRNRRDWRRAITGGALAIGLMAAFGAPAAVAEPEPTPVTDAPPSEQAEAPAPTGDVLALIASEYMAGAGGGQVSNFVKEALQLRALGFRPSKGNIDALTEALDKRPNQTPLVDALKQTVSYQRTLQRRAAAAGAPSNGFTLGTADTTDSDDDSGIVIGPSGSISQPIG